MELIKQITLDKFITFHHPKLAKIGDSLPLYEIHNFFGFPKKDGDLGLNPTDADVKLYNDTVDEWNTKNGSDHKSEFGDYQMKACHLGLIFRGENLQPVEVRVLQTSIYARSESLQDVIDQSHHITEFFKKKGFICLREKIEAMAYGADGIPQQSVDCVHYGEGAPCKDPYFETHIKVSFKDKSPSDPMTSEERNLLRTISEKITLEYGSPCPLSYNVSKDQKPDDKLGSQRYFNLRFRKMGVKDIEPCLKQIKELITSHGVTFVKTIFEYVIYDTCPEIDQGWIDFKPDEQQKLMDYLKKTAQ